MRRPDPIDPLRLGLLLACLSAGAADALSTEPSPAPATLSGTGLFTPGAPERIDDALLAFSPVYPLWSDGTRKQRWISLPEGGVVDARDPNAWEFPPGTKLWKTFGYSAPVETRVIERLADGTWRFSAYAWDADGREARLVPAAGVELAVAEAPGGRYRIPSREDCLACHGGTTSPVLGFSAVQLSPARDPGAPHAAPAGNGDTDLATLAAAGRLANLPAAMLAAPPRVASDDATERAALGYLHGNCGHCHNRSGLGVPVAMNLSLQWRGEALDADAIRRTLIGRTARYTPAGEAPGTLVVPGDPAASLLLQRMQVRDPHRQMPPLGTRSVDAQGLALLTRWISALPPEKDPTK